MAADFRVQNSPITAYQKRCQGIMGWIRMRAIWILHGNGRLTFNRVNGSQNQKEAKPMTDLYRFLADHHIEYERYDHPAVFTVEDVRRLVPPLPAAKTKNLFLRDQKGRRHFLLIVPADKRVAIKALHEVIGSSRLSFGSANRLKKYLGVDPGSVTLFALINDRDHEVELIIDESLWNQEAFQFHPLVNTSTLVVSRENLKRFLDLTGHEAKMLEVPEQ
jgi:Ala-tRNA(Pro) deacylase